MTEGYKQVPPPDRVTVPVAELMHLRAAAALLVAMDKMGVRGWDRFEQARWLVQNDPSYRAIALGDIPYNPGALTSNHE